MKSLVSRVITAACFPLLLRALGICLFPLGSGKVPGREIYLAFVILYFSCMIVLSWPIRYYKSILLLALVGSLSNSGSGAVLFCIATGWERWSIGTLLGHLSGLLLSFVATASVLVAIRFVMNRRDPIPLSGSCIYCGYDLRGLIEQRCPECGKSFEGRL
jgi:hypothetical protein